MIDSAFLALALERYRSTIIAALSQRSYVRSCYLEMPVEGLPGAEEVSLFVWPEPPGHPTRVGIDVVALNKRPLPRPIDVSIELEPSECPPVRETSPLVLGIASLSDERPSTIDTPAGRWHLVAGISGQREIRRVTKDGAAVWADVDTEVFAYRLNCPRCGRARFSKRNNLFQVRYCWVCTHQDRYRKRALRRFRVRERSVDARRRLTPQARADLVRQAATGKYTQAELAEMYGVTRSWVSRILKADE